MQTASAGIRAGGTVIRFENGIYGFEDIREFVLLKEDGGGAIWSLQAAGADCPSLLTVDPFLVLPGYRPEPGEEDLRLLGNPGAEDLCYLAVAVIRRNPAESVVNLKSPIAINVRAKTGRQIILENSDYPVRYRPFRDAGSAETEGA